MQTLRSYLAGRWQEGDGEFSTLVDPSTEAPVARTSSHGLDLGEALDHARCRGVAALAELTFAGRAELLAATARAIHEARDELIALSMANAGTTRKDAKFDIDGATFTLTHYAELGRALGARRVLAEGDPLAIGRSPRLVGRHVLAPLGGVAVCINAFNFPVWGLAEKAACALLAGMPVVAKPATSTALATVRAVEAIVAAGALPEGTLSLLCGSPGDLLDRLGPLDVVAFTGSADTARRLRAHSRLLEAGTRINVEADSLNAALLGPDVETGGETFALFLRDVAREITQKSGQKCTAVRRVLVPAARLDEVEAALVEALGATVTGNPRDPSVTMGPLATAAQLADALAGIERLAAEARIVHGRAARADGVGSPAGRGYFLAPVLLRAEAAEALAAAHVHEVFAPVATLMGWDGDPRRAAALVGRGGGSLVTSIYSDDPAFLDGYFAAGGATSGRLYLGSEKIASQAPGSGVALPQLLHGGPGRAGGGHELGGLGGLTLYQQRVAIQGDQALVGRLAGLRES